MKKKLFLILSALLVTLVGYAYGYVEYPKAIGDLVFRDSKGVIYGRDGDYCYWLIPDKHFYPGHVGIYIGDDKIVHALGTILGGEVKETKLGSSLVASPGEETFYFNKDGESLGYPLGAKTHRALLNNPNATRLRKNVRFLAMKQIGEGYDNSFHQQKGPGPDEWTCVGLTEKIYESSAGRTLIYHSNYGDQHLYDGGLNITPDGYYPDPELEHCHYQNYMEFSQIPDLVGLGRKFELLLVRFIFFPWTQFEQPTLIDSFEQRPNIIPAIYPLLLSDLPTYRKILYDDFSSIKGGSKVRHEGGG